MQDNDVEHVTGRRLDVNGGNIIMFRGADPVVNYGGPKRGNDQDMLEYVRSQEQKLKLEKLKWQESTTRVQALHKPPATVKPAAVQKEKPVQRVKPSEMEARKTVDKPKPNPKHVAEVIEGRNKRASQWLHKEQQEYQAKKAEILEHKRAAKELDQRRRSLEMIEAQRKRQKQLALLQEDPAFALALPLEASDILHTAVPSVLMRAPIPSSEPVTLPHTAGSDTEGELRVSHNTLVIHQVAAKLQLPTPPENELLAMRKRPGVPRLSKSYVNKAQLVSGQGEQDVEGEHKETAKPHAEPASKAVADAPLLLPRRAHGKPKPISGAESDGSDEYGDDEDFEADEPGKGAATLAADNKLVERLLGEERHGKAHGKATEESDESEAEVAVDAITERTAAESQKRREDGRQYADRRRHQLHKQEAEAKRQRALEEAKRQQALQLLKTHVVSINKRTKHTTSSVSDGRGQSQSTATASLRSMLGATEAAPEDADEVIAPAPKEDEHDRRPVGIRNAPPQSPARYALAEEKEADMRDVDPVEVGGWNEFLRQESARAVQRQRPSPSAPEDEQSRPTTAPSTSQARNSTSPPRLRPTTVVKSTQNAPQAGKTTRTATPPPFRFSSGAKVPQRPTVTITAPVAITSRDRTAPRRGNATSIVKRKPNGSSAGARHPRSTSAGSVGMSRRTRQTSEPAARPPSRSQSQGRSRSVFHADALEGDALDLFDRRYHHSSDDEVEYGEPDHDPIVSHHSSAASSGVGLGGYLSKSPARVFRPEDGHTRTRNLYGPSPHVAAVLQEVTSCKSRAGTKSLEEQRLMQDVSSQAFRNFEQVAKVLKDVDRWCELAKEETLQLKEKLRMRESTESLSAVPVRIRETDIRQSPPRNERESLPTASVRPALSAMTPPDEQDIAVIRSSLAGKLSSRAQELFVDSSSGGGSSSDTSKVEDSERSQDISRESAEIARPTVVSEPESRNSIDEWRRQNAAVRARQSITKIPAVAAEKPTAPSSSSFRGVIERKQSVEETEDSVLMADPDDHSAAVSEHSGEDSEAADSAEEQDGDEEEDSYLRGVRERYEAHAQMAGAPQPPRYENTTDFVQLAGRSADRPILWSAGPDRNAEAFSTKDPLLAQQLGMAADRNEILAKYSRLDLDSSMDAPPSRSTAMGSPSRYQHREEEAAEVRDEEDWTQPFTRPAPVTKVPADKEQAYLPSLRNVGELAGLLRSTYKAELETEAGRSAMLDAGDSEDEDSSDACSDMGGDYDSYSAVSIMAARMMAKQGEVLKAKEKQLESKATSELPAEPTTAVVASEDRADDEPVSAASTPVKDEIFWAETLVKPERQLPDSEDVESSVALEEMLHDYALDLRYGADGGATLAPPRASMATASGGETEAGPDAPKKIRFSGAEMRARMMEELRKQDELFNYTIELAELEKTHAMQQARDLAMQAQHRSAEELDRLQQRQELEMQRLAYENSLALSLVSAQGVMEKQSAEQREQLLQMQSRLSAQELFRQYQDLLHQADQVAGNLEQNQKLQEMERLLQEDKAREIVAGLESKHAVEKAAMMVAHAEVQKSHAEALVAASRTSMELLAQQRASGEGLRGSRDSHPRHSREGQRPAPSAPTRYQQDSDEDNYEEEYSAQFETEASMSMRSRTTPMSAPVRKPLQRHANASDSEEESIPEDDDKSATHDPSSAISDSIAYSPDVSRKPIGGRYGEPKPAQKVLQTSMQSSHLSVSTASGRGAAAPAGAQRRAYDSDSEPDEVEDSIDQNRAAAEVSEASVFESYVESPAKAPYQSAQSYSQSSRAFEVSELSRPPPRAPQGQAKKPQQFAASQSSGNFEVEESGERSGSIAEEVPDESEGTEENYSDTFEASGSKSSKAASSISSGAPAARGNVTAPRAVTAAPAAMLPTKTPRSSIPALESSSDSGAVFANSSIPSVLDEYRLEMEGRLRAQEKTYKLKVQFLKAKQTQRLEWLAKVKQNAKIGGADIADEEQRIHDAYAEERAEVERERWALNARAYKELRKFKRLRRDLMKYQVNVQNSAQAAAELEANLLSLRQSHESGEFGSFPLGRSSRGKRNVLQDSSDSVNSSSDSAPAFGQANKASRTAPRVSAARAQPVQRPVPAAATASSEVEEEYPEDDFETTFSTAAVSPQKAPSAHAADIDASEASYSDNYEASVPAKMDNKLAQSMQSVPESTKDVSSASEVSSESVSEAMDDSGMESEPEASYRPESDSEPSPAVAAQKPPADARFSADFEETLEESPQKLAAQGMDSREQSPARVVDAAPVVVAEESEDDYNSYDEDFVQESDQASEGRPGLQEAARREESPAKGAVHMAPAGTEEEESPEVEDDIESEISAYGRESDASDEPYYLSSSAAKAEVLIAPIERKADVSLEVAKEPSIAEEGEASYSEDEFSQHSAERSQVESAQVSPAKQLDVSTHSAVSAGSAAAAREEDADEVQYGDDEEFAEYESDHEEEEKDAARAAVVPASPPAKSPIAAGQKSPEESLNDSIATSISEEDEVAASARLDQSGDSGSEDYLATTNASLSLKPVDRDAAEENADLHVDVPSPSETSPQRVHSAGSASTHTKLSIQTTTPTGQDANPASSPEKSKSSAEPEVEFWGSEDFLESPAVLNRKTSELMLHHTSGSSVPDGDDMEGEDEDDPKKMRYDPEQQRWVGGEEVSLDGFDESVDAVGNDAGPASSATASKDPNASQEVDDFAEVDTSLEEDLVHDAENGSQHDISQAEKSLEIKTKPIGVADVATVEPEDDYASDEFSFEEEAPAAVTGGDSTLPASPVKDALPSVEEDPEDEVPEDLQESVDDDADEVVPSHIDTRVPDSKRDMSVLSAVSEVPMVDESGAASASDLSGLLAELQDAEKPVPVPVVEEAPMLSDQDTMEGNLTDMSLDYLEPAESPQKPKTAAAVVVPARAASPEDSLLDAVLDMSYDDEAVELTSEATEYAEMNDFRTDFVEAAWETEAEVAVKADVKDQVHTVGEGKRDQEEQDQRLVLVEEVTDHLLDALVESECARVLQLVPAASAYVAPAFTERTAPSTAEPKTRSPQRIAEPAREQPKATEKDVDVKEDSTEFESTADLLAENMMKHSSKFGKPETSSSIGEKESGGSKTSLSSLGSLPSLGKSSLPPVSVHRASVPMEEDDDLDSKEIERPAEFGDDEDLYEFDIPSSHPAPGAVVHPPHGTEEPTKDEPQAGAALIAAVVAAEAVNARCAEIVNNTKTFLDEVLARPDLQLADQLADPEHEGRFLDAVPPSPEDLIVAVGDAQAVHAAALTDRINELCAEIFSAKHGSRTAGGDPSLPLPKRLLLQSLPLREDAVKAHIARCILAEQQELVEVLRTGGDAPEAPVNVDIVDNFRLEAQREIELASNQMADALLARCLIDTCAELGQLYDMSALFAGVRK